MTNPHREKAPRQLALMRARAELLRWRVVPRVRKPGQRRFNPWLPLVPVLIVLSPALLLVAGVAVFLPRPFRINPATVMLNLGRAMIALSEGDPDGEAHRQPRISDERS
ncbi:MAG: hypothetical protein KA220_00930 [Phenylobacterium sp.]|nr:hypothetical protein [Phenylobacterium sp.]